MKRIAFFDTKAYDKEWFDACNQERFEIEYYESKLTAKTVGLAAGADAVCAFVNDDLSAGVLGRLKEMKVSVIAMRCAGFSNIDFKPVRGGTTLSADTVQKEHK